MDTRGAFRNTSEFEVVDEAIRRVVREAVDIERARKYMLLEQCWDWSAGRNFSRNTLSGWIKNLLSSERKKDENSS